MFVASLKFWLKNFKGPRHGLRLKFQFLFMKWITCSFWMIGKNINIKGQVTSEIYTEARIYCYVIKVRFIY